MVQMISKERCSGCEACGNICPADAIYMELDEEGFYYPKVRQDRCISCGRCVQVCPSLNLLQQDGELPYAAACYAKDSEIRRRSTSGGMFSIFSEYIIRKMNGIVYGVKFDDLFQTTYSRAESLEDLRALCGSKYAQSRVNMIYRDVKEQLESGRYVLFSGLPCHVEGLAAFLGKSYPGLYLLDMACFGIASPYIWQEYLKHFHQKEKISEIVFKDKAEGWKHWKVKFVENGEETRLERKDDLYMSSYLSRINIRKSCFQCPFKGLRRISDFTIADCWGEGEKNREMNDDKGMSALLVHTQKGKDLFEAVEGQIIYQQYDAEILMAGNWAASRAVSEHEERGSFFQALKERPFQEVFKEFFGR